MGRGSAGGGRPSVHLSVLGGATAPLAVLTLLRAGGCRGGWILAVPRRAGDPGSSAGLGAAWGCRDHSPQPSLSVPCSSQLALTTGSWCWLPAGVVTTGGCGVTVPPHGCHLTHPATRRVPELSAGVAVWGGDPHAGPYRVFMWGEEAAEPPSLPQLLLFEGFKGRNQLKRQLCKSCRRHTGCGGAPLRSRSRSASLQASHLIPLTHLCNQLTACKKPQIHGEGGAGCSTGSLGTAPSFG